MISTSENIVVDPGHLMEAIGSNATYPENMEGTWDEQKAIAEIIAKTLLPLTMLDNELVITHDSGPVVSKILMRQSLTRDSITPMPLHICVAHSQGGIKYLLMRAMENTVREQGNQRHSKCLLAQVKVDPNDPAFSNPSKPIGPFFEKEEAKKIGQELGWSMKEYKGSSCGHRQRFDIGSYG